MIFLMLLSWLVNLLIAQITGWYLPTPEAVLGDFVTSFGYLWGAAGKLSNWISWWAIPPALILVFGCWFAGFVISLFFKFLSLILELIP